MIEFKRAGDVMVFECPAFKVEVVADAERIEFSDTLHDPVERVTEAFKVLDMMIEHKNKQSNTLKVGPDITFDVKRSNPSKVVSEMHVKVNVDTKDVEEALDKLSRRYSGTCMRHYPEKLEGI